MTDLSNFSIAELRDLQARVSFAIRTREKTEIANVQQRILEIARGVGMTVEDIMKGVPTKKPSKAAIRYQHPEDRSKQWTGRGRQPRWIKEYLDASGRQLDSLSVG